MRFITIWDENIKLNNKHKIQLNTYFERLNEVNTDRKGHEWCYDTKLLIIGYTECLHDTGLISYQELQKINYSAEEIYQKKYGGIK